MSGVRALCAVGDSLHAGGGGPTIRRWDSSSFSPGAPLTTTHTEDVTALASDSARGARQAAARLFVASLDTTVRSPQRGSGGSAGVGEGPGACVGVARVRSRTGLPAARR